jgi:preprotein translocase subunit SecF
MFAIIHRKIFLVLGLAITLFAIASILGFGVRFGIDFTGGSMLVVRYDIAPEKSAVETAVASMELGEVSVREAGDGVAVGQGYMIRTRAVSDEERQQLEALVLQIGEGGQVDQFTSVGPTIGAELKEKSWWAIGLISLIIILYVAYAFAGIGTPVSSWVYGGITILVLIHDILIPTAVMAFLGWVIGAEAGVLFVMALLAILGYSVNDTIVVFDRVRENIANNRTPHNVKVKNSDGLEETRTTYTLNKPFTELVGKAVEQSLARSVNTSVTTLITLTALYFLGGTLTQTFALILMAGVIAGTYSSLLIASPLLVTFAEWQEHNRLKQKNK